MNEENSPVEKDTYYKYHLIIEKCHFFSSFKIFTGMLFGPDDLPVSQECCLDQIICVFCQLELRKVYLYLYK